MELNVNPLMNDEHFISVAGSSENNTHKRRPKNLLIIHLPFYDEFVEGTAQGYNDVHKRIIFSFIQIHDRGFIIKRHSIK